jgi:hypothetical protein
MTISVAVSWGELIDKITILEIKRAHMTDPDQLANVGKEYELLTTTRDAALPDDVDMDNDTKALKLINETLWQIEDDIRDCEQAQDFGETFIDLARSVYRINDRRAAIKRRINEMLGSELVEEKLYRSYD